MAPAGARRPGLRVTALLLLGIVSAPHAMPLARAWVSGSLGACCTDRSCCCPPKATPTSCHEGAAATASAVRCHHAAPEAPAPALTALLSPPLSVAIRHAEGLAPAAAAPGPRLGFGRIVSPPPRAPENE
jgi:hypothetical protein